MPQPFKNRPSRVCPLSHPSQALPYPIPCLLSRPRCAWRWGALAGLPQRAGHAGRAIDGVWPPAGGAGGRAAGVAAPKGRLNFLFALVQTEDGRMSQEASSAPGAREGNNFFGRR